MTIDETDGRKEIYWLFFCRIGRMKWRVYVGVDEGWGMEGWFPFPGDKVIGVGTP